MARPASVFEEHSAQWRDGHADGTRTSVNAYRVRFDSAKIPQATAPILPRITIEYFLPESITGHTNAVVDARNRCKIANHQNDLLGVAGLTNEADATLLAIVAINPLEPGWIKIQFVQRPLRSKKMIQIGQPLSNAVVRGILKEMPIETGLVVPFAALCQFSAHE